MRVSGSSFSCSCAFINQRETIGSLHNICTTDFLDDNDRFFESIERTTTDPANPNSENIEEAPLLPSVRANCPSCCATKFLPLRTCRASLKNCGEHHFRELGHFRGISMGTFHFCTLVGSVPRVPTQQKIDSLALRDTLLIHARLRVGLHRRADFGMAHQLLHHLAMVAQRQLPMDYDYAVPTREYQTDQSSLIAARAAARSVLLERRRQPQKTHDPRSGHGRSISGQWAHRHFASDGAPDARRPPQGLTWRQCSVGGAGDPSDQLPTKTMRIVARSSGSFAAIIGEPGRSAPQLFAASPETKNIR